MWLWLRRYFLLYFLRHPEDANTKLSGEAQFYCRPQTMLINMFARKPGLMLFIHQTHNKKYNNVNIFNATELYS